MFFFFPAYLIDKVKIKGYYAFKLTEEKSKPRFGFFTSDFKAKSSVQFYSKLISSSGFSSENRSPACGQPPEDTECAICSFLTQKKPLIFFGCCFISTLAALLSITEVSFVRLLDGSLLRNIDAIQKLPDILVFNCCGLLNQSR